MRKTTTIVHDSRTWSNLEKLFIIIHIFTKMISFACAFAVFLHSFYEHIWMIASDYHSNFSIIPDIFRYYKKALFNDRYSKWNMSNHIISKGEKRTKKLINTNVITRHNAIAMSRDLQSWRSSISLFEHIYYF